MPITETLQAANDSYDSDLTSMSALMNRVECVVGRPLEGQEIGEIVDSFCKRIDDNYQREVGSSGCSYDMF